MYTFLEQLLLLEIYVLLEQVVLGFPEAPNPYLFDTRLVWILVICALLPYYLDRFLLEL
jgi:hypothetical protein